MYKTLRYYAKLSKLISKWIEWIVILLFRLLICKLTEEIII